MNELAKNLIAAARERKLKISALESCTGGLISAMLTDIPGASEVIEECIVTYSNEAKRRELNVSAETLRNEGAVSRSTAYQMADGICRHTGADIGIAVTGIAGPGGGTPEKPVGTVFAGINICGNINVYEFHFGGNREEVRTQTCENALRLAVKGILLI